LLTRHAKELPLLLFSIGTEEEKPRQRKQIKLEYEKSPKTAGKNRRKKKKKNPRPIRARKRKPKPQKPYWGDTFHHYLGPKKGHRLKNRRGKRGGEGAGTPAAQTGYPGAPGGMAQTRTQRPGPRRKTRIGEEKLGSRVGCDKHKKRDPPHQRMGWQKRGGDTGRPIKETS